MDHHIIDGLRGELVTIKNCTVTNANYERVLAVMEKVIPDRFDSFCCCSRCMSDIAALALNYLPPHYIVDAENNRSGELGSPWVMVESAVTEAIDRVKEYPNHSR